MMARLQHELAEWETRWFLIRLNVPMDSSQSPPPNDRRREGDVVLLVPKDRPTLAEAPSVGPVREADAGRDSADEFIGTGWGGSDFSAGLGAAEPMIDVTPGLSAAEPTIDVIPGLRAVEPAIDVSPSSDFKDEQFASDRPSSGRRIVRAVAGFVVAALIGVGATFAWQSHGDEAREMVGTWVPALDWLSSGSTTKLPADGDVAPVQTQPAAAGQRSGQVAALPQPAPAPQTMPAPAAAATAPASVQQLEAMARDLAVVRRSVEQLAAKQEQMAHSIAALQALEQDIREKTSSLSPPRSARVPPRRNAPRVEPPQPAAQSWSAQSPSVHSPPVHPPSVQSPAMQSPAVPPPPVSSPSAALPPAPRPPLPVPERPTSGAAGF
jgi:hypothetical protein